MVHMQQKQLYEPVSNVHCMCKKPQKTTHTYTQREKKKKKSEKKTVIIMKYSKTRRKKRIKYVIRREIYEENAHWKNIDSLAESLEANGWETWIAICVLNGQKL